MGRLEGRTAFAQGCDVGDRGWSRIANFGSLAAAEGPTGLGEYAAAKTGITGLTYADGGAHLGFA